MKKSFLFSKIFVSIGFIFLLSGCGGTERDGEYEFDYYPERNIYYDIQSSKFIYSLDGGKNWENYNTKFSADSALLGRKEKVYSKSAEVWRENKSHVEMYEGKVFTVLNDTDKNFAAVNEEVSDKPVATRGAGVVKKSPPPAKKKGVKGFFNRIFGKKDKK